LDIFFQLYHVVHFLSPRQGFMRPYCPHFGRTIST
jgi:hypothetical protein